jgi:hypothetical protein
MRNIRRPRGMYLALGLLTLCAVFAATAGVREALVTTTQALRQTFAAAPPLAKTITVSGAASTVAASLRVASPRGTATGDLTDAQLTEVTDLRAEPGAVLAAEGQRPRGQA